MPDHFLARNKFCDLLFGTVHIFIPVGELGAEPVSVTLDLSRPPPTDIVDRFKNLFRRLVH
jgi:hypothetical protein